MVLYPEVFKKAQREIDAVIGRQRLPAFEDAASLPYLDCLVKEVYRYVMAMNLNHSLNKHSRWHPPVPLGKSRSSLCIHKHPQSVLSLGLPHRLMADDIYDGHHIPKGKFNIDYTEIGTDR